jgi:hypothetical protein
VKARDVREGDLIDMQGDPYFPGEMTQNVAEFEYAEVSGVEWDGPDCVVVHTDQGSFGMPPNHWLKEGER